MTHLTREEAEEKLRLFVKALAVEGWELDPWENDMHLQEIKE